MKLRIDIELGPHGLVAATADGFARLDESDVVAFAPDFRERVRLAAIGPKGTELRGPRDTVPAYSVEEFNPEVTAGVVGWAAEHLWSLRRPRLLGLLGIFDRVDIHVTLDRFDEIPQDLRRQFVKALPYLPQFHWWMGDREIRQ